MKLDNIVMNDNNLLREAAINIYSVHISYPLCIYVIALIISVIYLIIHLIMNMYLLPLKV